MVIYYDVSFSSTPLRATDSMPELVRRVALILAALAGLVAARFLRRPHLAGLIVPLWHRLQRVAPRLGRVMARPVVMRARPEGSAAPDRDRNAGDAVASGAGVGGKTALA